MVNAMIYGSKNAKISTRARSMGVMEEDSVLWPENPIVIQIKMHKEKERRETQRQSHACLQVFHKSFLPGS